MIKRYASARSILGKKNRKLTSAIHYVPTITLLALPFILLSAGFVPEVRIPFFFVMGTYTFLLLSNGIFYAVKDKRPSYMLYLPLLIFVIHFGWAIGFLEGFFAKKTTIRGVNP